MKKAFLSKILFSVILLGLFAVSSCKKSHNSSPSGYYLKFKLDGTDKQYSLTTAFFTTQGPFYNCSMTGENDISGTAEGMSIFLYSDAAITANTTYTDAEVTVDGQSTTQATLLYADGNGKQEGSTFLFSPNVKVTITGIDASSVTGTFSGTIANTTDNSETQVVTEGQFRLQKQ